SICSVLMPAPASMFSTGLNWFSNCSPNGVALSDKTAIFAPAATSMSSGKYDSGSCMAPLPAEAAAGAAAPPPPGAPPAFGAPGAPGAAPPAGAPPPGAPPPGAPPAGAAACSAGLSLLPHPQTPIARQPTPSTQSALDIADFLKGKTKTGHFIT